LVGKKKTGDGHTRQKKKKRKNFHRAEKGVMQDCGPNKKGGNELGGGEKKGYPRGKMRVR